MKSVILAVLVGLIIVSVASAQGLPAVQEPFGVPQSTSNNETTCANSCSEEEVCLLCADGNSGCFSNKLSTHYCCGCDASVSRCTACSNANLCVENSGTGLKWECKSPTVTLVVLSIMGGVLLAFVLLIVLAFLWHRRNRSTPSDSQQNPSRSAATEEDALLSFRADSTLGVYHAWPPTAVAASVGSAKPSTDSITSQDPAIST